jgi:cysteine desulfurase
MRRIYLDHSATTPVDPRVVEAMLPYFTAKFGNPSSVHQPGQDARAGVDRARRQIAAFIGAHANEIVFTSGGTEANNLAIHGIAEAAESHGRHLIISAFEHPSVRASADVLQKNGWEVTILPVYEEGLVRVADLCKALRPDTVLISIMMANNEIGTVQPIAEVGSVVRGLRDNGRRHIWFHTDAVQAAGRVPLDVNALGCDLLSLSAHKIYAPKGTGALFVRKGVRLFPQQHGGHQERERRGGTEAVANIVAFGAAAEMAQKEMPDRNEYVRRLRDRFEAELSARVSEFVFNGARISRLPHLSNVSFRFIEGEGLLIHLDMQGVAVSTGSACSSGTIEPSPVIRALGRDDELARGSIRFSFGKDNTETDVDYAVEMTARAVDSLRQVSPLVHETATVV